MSRDVPALVAALREARAEAKRATTWHMEALDDLAACAAERDEARAEVERLALVVTSLTAMVEAKSSWIDGARIDIDGLEAERDDWRRRYEALRDGVTGLCDERDEWLVDDFGPCETWPTGTVHTALVEVPALRAVVARVEGDES